MNDKELDISLVIPLFNEEESIPELFEWIKRVLQGKYIYEVIFIDDGSKDNSWEEILKLKKHNPEIVGVKFRRNYGKSAGLNVGFESARGKVVVTMDADLQDSPEEIPELYDLIHKDGYDLVSGWKKKRYDPISKTIPTKFYNWSTRMMSGIKLHDFNCGLKAYSNRVVKSIEVYGEMHRYIPVIAKRAGFEKITEKVVAHQARKYGTTKFGLERFINGPLDLLSITFITRFGRRPMHIFGVFGVIMFFISFLIFLWMGIHKVFIDQEATLLANRTEFYVSLVFMIIGSQLFLTGFLGEMISRNSTDRNKYLIEEII